MPRLLFSVFFLSLLQNLVSAQALNDDCAGAIPINNPSSYCSGSEAFSTEGSTPSQLQTASCFSGQGHDVWFSFVSRATDLTITVIGDAEPGNSLAAPQLAIYKGSCAGILVEWQCQSSEGQGIVELTQGGLSVGERYFIRVQGATAAGGASSFARAISTRRSSPDKIALPCRSFATSLLLWSKKPPGPAKIPAKPTTHPASRAAT